MHREAVLAEGVKRGRGMVGQANMGPRALHPTCWACSSPLTSVGREGSCPGCTEESAGVLAVDQTLRRQISKGLEGLSQPQSPPTPGRAVSALSGWALGRAGLGHSRRALPTETRQRGHYPSGFQGINLPGGGSRAPLTCRWLRAGARSPPHRSHPHSPLPRHTAPPVEHIRHWHSGAHPLGTGAQPAGTLAGEGG